MPVRLARSICGQERRQYCAASIIAATLVAALAGCGASTGSGRTGGSTPTATPAVTAIPSTYTPNPLTPTPTTEEQHLDALVQQAIGVGAVQIGTTYSVMDGATDVEITYSQVVPLPPGGLVPTSDADIAAAQERVKTICFEVEQALWTSSTTPLSQVNVAVLGPVLDQYAFLTTQAYSSVLLKAATAAHFTWSTLTPDTAWAKYDSNYLRADYSDVD
jgi:hypothetical protein